MKSRGTRELDINSYNTQGIKENMYWIPINNLRDYRVYSRFFREKLNNLKNEIEHIVTYE